MTEPSAILPPPPPPGPPAPPAAPTAGGRGKGKKAIIGGVVAAVVLGGGYGAYAVYDKLDGGGPQPHDVMPASSQFYMRVDVDPSASQKIELLKLIRKFPEVAKEIGIESPTQDVRKLIFDGLVANECDDIDYEDDVKPWLGDRIGVGGEMKAERFVIAVQTTNEAKSREGIKKLFKCADADYGIAYLDGYAILSEKQSDVDASIKATEKGTLGDKKAFIDDFDALGDQGIASAWVDLEAIADIPEAKEALGDQLDELKKAGSVATTLRVDGNAIEFAALGGLEQKGDDQPISLNKLPSDTVVALSVAGLGDQVTEGFDAMLEGLNSGFAQGFAGAPGIPGSDSGDFDDFDSDPTADDFGTDLPNDDFGSLTDDDNFGGSPNDVQQFIDQIEQETGFKLPDDLQTLFGDSLTLAIGADNLETIPTMSGPDDFSALNVALALTTDKTKALDLVKRIADLASGAGIPLIAEPTGDGAVLATNQDAADAIVKPDGKLGDEKSFKELIPNADKTYGGFYVNIGAILDKILQADPPEEIRSVVKDIKPLSAVGLSVSKADGNRSLVSFRVSFK